MLKNGWYCCDDCGRKLLAINKKTAIDGVRIRCRGKKGHIQGRVRAVRIEPKKIHDVEALQVFIEKVHIAMNKGECQSYNICKYCLEPETLVKTCTTPCANAFLRMFQKTKKKYIFSVRDWLKR